MEVDVNNPDVTEQQVIKSLNDRRDYRYFI